MNLSQIYEGRMIMLDRNAVARIASGRGIAKLDLILKDYIQDKKIQ